VSDLAGAEQLITARLSLRRPVTADVAAILAVHQNRRATEHNPTETLTSRGQAESLFRRWDDHWDRNGFGYWVVRRHEDDDSLGFCGLKVMPLDGRPALNLFYRFDPACWGQGVASEAAGAVVWWATIAQPHYPLIARVRPENTASHHVAVNAGLERAEHLDREGFDGFDCIYTHPTSTFP